MIWKWDLGTDNGGRGGISGRGIPAGGAFIPRGEEEKEKRMKGRLRAREHFQPDAFIRVGSKPDRKTTAIREEGGGGDIKNNTNTHV